MKKRLLLLACFIAVIFVFTGCGGESSGSSTSSEPDDIALMSYAQTIIDDYLPGADYSHLTEDWNFIGGDNGSLRYKMTTNVNGKKAEIIIEFDDNKYESYTVKNFSVGSTKYV